MRVLRSALSEDAAKNNADDDVREDGGGIERAGPRLAGVREVLDLNPVYQSQSADLSSARAVAHVTATKPTSDWRQYSFY